MGRVLLAPFPLTVLELVRAAEVEAVARTAGRDLALQIKRPQVVLEVCLEGVAVEHNPLALFNSQPLVVLVEMVQSELSGPATLVNSLRLT
jgi:hypothetical protein